MSFDVLNNMGIQHLVNDFQLLLAIHGPLNISTRLYECFHD